MAKVFENKILGIKKWVFKTYAQKFYKREICGVVDKIVAAIQLSLGSILGQIKVFFRFQFK